MSRTIYTGCTRPLKAFPLGIKENGKTNYKITNYSCDHLEKDKHGNWQQVGVTDRLYGATDIVRDFIELPCGSCPACKLQKSRQWAYRCIAESLYHEQNWFLTLTYDDEHLYIPPGADVPSLCKKDLQDFWKRLRWSGQEFKYFAAGEYGPENGRPHYHALLFGLCLDKKNLVLYKQNNGNPLFISPMLSRIWDKGYVVVGKVTLASAKYVSRYTYKKNGLDNNRYSDTMNVEPEFCVMSRRPGLGTQFLKDHAADLYGNSYIPFAGDDGAERIYPTKFWTEKLKDIDAAFYEKVKAKNIEMNEIKKQNLVRDDRRPYTDILREQEYLYIEKTKSIAERSRINEKAN